MFIKLFLVLFFFKNILINCQTLDTRILTLKGFVYEDLDRNALYDENEPKLSGVLVKCTNNQTDYENQLLEPKRTDSNGTFIFDGLLQRKMYEFTLYNLENYIFEDYSRNFTCSADNKNCYRPTTLGDGYIGQFLFENVLAYQIPLTKSKNNIKENHSISFQRFYIDLGYVRQTRSPKKN